MEAQLNCVCDYVKKVNVLDNETAVVEAIDDAEENKTADCDEIQANTNNSNNHEYVAAVINYNVNGSGAADDNLDEIVVELLQTMDVEENGADKENIPRAMVVMDVKPRALPESQIVRKRSLIGTKVSMTYLMMCR
jgi:hypothetical protein